MHDRVTNKRSTHIPVRTCVGCKERAPQSELLRFYRRHSRVLPNPKRRMPGRGAYVHRLDECLERALAGGLARSFRAKVSVPEAISLEGAKSQEGQS